MMKRRKAIAHGRVFAAGLTVLGMFPVSSLSEEITSTITATVVSPENAALLDFDEGVICSDNKCRIVKLEKAEYICPPDEWVLTPEKCKKIEKKSLARAR